MHVILCGGGVIGACTAYYLARRGARVTVVERTAVANAASGKSGGFLALDWCRGTEMDQMARHSFGLHQELATDLKRDLGLEWGYRRVETLSVVASERRDLKHLARQPTLEWLGPAASVHDAIGTRDTTAQLDPALFTQSMMKAAEKAGATLKEATVEGIELSAAGDRATGVLVDGETLKGDTIVVAMGPWSILACQWLPLPGIFGLKGHSLLFQYSPGDDAPVLFVEVETDDEEIETPEVVPRSDGTTYVCGLSSQSLMPVDPAAVTSDAGATMQLQKLTALFAPDLASAPVLASQACHRPVTEDGLPVIGAVPKVAGAFIASGHGVWGMLNGPATGQAMADLILEGQSTHLDLSAFDPARLPRFDPERLETKK